MTDKIRVVHLINDLLVGGAQRVVYDITSHLSGDSFDVYIASLFDFKRSTRPNIVHLLDQKKLTYTCFDFSQSGLLPFYTLWNYLRKTKPDILHCHLPYTSIIGLVIGTMAGVPQIVVHEHNTYKFYAKKIRWMLALTRCLRRITLCYSGQIEQETFGKQEVLEKPQHAYPARSYTIHNAIALDEIDQAQRNTRREQKRHELGFASDDLLLICVARLLDWKGQATLIQAFKLLVDEWPQAHLLIVGDGPMQKVLEELAGNLRGKRIHLLGPRLDAYELLAISDVYSSAYTYPEGFAATEAYGVASLEALAARLPVVLSDYPSAHALVKADVEAVLVPPKDAPALARAISDLFRSPERRRALGEQARRLIEDRFAW
ncbi:glycosyltransferase, partial [Candidatus Uhrbacteria bacterium]|nr:glycosyltransferase [Candidatus Uhrbacteria bacterium]